MAPGSERKGCGAGRFSRRVACFVALWVAVCVFPGSPARAGEPEVDVAALVQAYTAFDGGYREGKGRSESSDASVLGWGESGFLQNYVKMYGVTGDARWLDKVVEHFDRMVAHMTDPDGDGIPGWQTDRYSVSRMSARPLYNRSGASVAPEHERVRNIKQAHQAVDGLFGFERASADVYRLVELPAIRVLYEGPYTPGSPVPELPGFEVRVEGLPAVGDKFLVETQAVRPLGYAVHEGMVLYPIAQFIEIVMKDAGLKARFGDAAAGYLKVIEERILRKQERYWLQTGPDEGAYRFTASPAERFPNRILPHNQYLALGRAYLVLKDVADNPLYGTRAVQMANYFRRHLEAVGDAWAWHYWNWSEGGEDRHSGPEDTSHGRIDIEFAVEACRRGVVFTDSDLTHFANTFTRRMWNGDPEAPRIGDRVDRTRGDAKAYEGWIDLCRWDPTIWNIYWQLFQNADRKPVSAIPSILLARASLDAERRR